MSRAIFVSGGNPFQYMNALNASLFLSANAADVRKAVDGGLPAGRVFPTTFADLAADSELRIAFDFDGVVGDDSSEAVYKKKGLGAFQTSEIRHAMEPVREGPLARFFREVSRLQRLEREKKKQNSKYVPRLRTAIVTARDAPAHNGWSQHSVAGASRWTKCFSWVASKKRECWRYSDPTSSLMTRCNTSKEPPVQPRVRTCHSELRTS